MLTDQALAIIFKSDADIANEAYALFGEILAETAVWTYFSYMNPTLTEIKGRNGVAYDAHDQIGEQELDHILRLAIGHAEGTIPDWQVL